MQDIFTNMNEDYFDLLTEEELAINKRVRECNTIEELLQLADELSALNENSDFANRKVINMSVEEFKKKYNLVDIKDLNGKYGF